MTLRLAGSTSGYTEIDAPAVAGSNIIQLPAGNGSPYQILRNGATAGSLEYADKLVLGTAQNSTSGTSIDFTGIPSWVKRVTVMFNGVSLSGTSSLLVQLGSTTFTTSGYTSTGNSINNASASGGLNSTAGFAISVAVAIDTVAAIMTIHALGSNTWVSAHSGKQSTTNVLCGGGNVTLSGTLDRVRITTVNGTDTFDAGSINILYE